MRSTREQPGLTTSTNEQKAEELAKEIADPCGRAAGCSTPEQAYIRGKVEEYIAFVRRYERWAPGIVAEVFVVEVAARVLEGKGKGGLETTFTNFEAALSTPFVRDPSTLPTMAGGLACLNPLPVVVLSLRENSE